MGEVVTFPFVKDDDVKHYDGLQYRLEQVFNTPEWDRFINYYNIHKFNEAEMETTDINNVRVNLTLFTIDGEYPVEDDGY